MQQTRVTKPGGSTIWRVSQSKKWEFEPHGPLDVYAYARRRHRTQTSFHRGDRRRLYSLFDGGGVLIYYRVTRADCAESRALTLCTGCLDG